MERKYSSINSLPIRQLDADCDPIGDNRPENGQRLDLFPMFHMAVGPEKGKWTVYVEKKLPKCGTKFQKECNRLKIGACFKR